MITIVNIKIVKKYKTVSLKNDTIKDGRLINCKRAIR